MLYLLVRAHVCRVLMKLPNACIKCVDTLNDLENVHWLRDEVQAASIGT